MSPEERYIDKKWRYERHDGPAEDLIEAAEQYIHFLEKKVNNLEDEVTDLNETIEAYQWEGIV